MTRLTEEMRAMKTARNMMLNIGNNGNFICVFECTIVNLAKYRQFTKSKLHYVWAIPVPVSTKKM